MTSKQIQKKITQLENAESLSDANSKLLRQLRAALPKQIADEAKRKDTREKLASYTDVEAAPRREVDDGLSGAAWINWFNKYCDPKKIAQASLEDSPEQERRPKRVRQTERPIEFPINSRRVVLTSDIPKGVWIDLNAPAKREGRKSAKASVSGIGRLTLETVKRFVEAADAGRLVETFGEKRAARLERKMPVFRSALATA